ncbi:MAG TPA: hypothetical protein ENO23_00575, partial [Alphaproteobacteria bacterium]|nr:hypothetical protein [Alphaproteobacteria bacterium]
MVRRKAHIFSIAALVLGAAALVAGVLPGSASAQPVASDWAATEQVDVRLVSAASAVGDLEELRLGLHFRMRPGWKIYWRSPGQAGFPPEADWSQSSNLGAVETAWPAPHRFTIFDMETMGYKDEVVLPLTVRPERPGQPLSLRAEVNYLTCKELCIPGNAMLSLHLPAGPATPTTAAPLIDRYRAQVPQPADAFGVEVAQAVMKPTEESVLLRVALASESPMAEPDLFVEGPITAFFGKPEIDLSADGRRAVMTLKGAGATPDEFAAEPLLVTLVDGERAVEQRVTGSLVKEFPALPGGFAGPARAAPVVSMWVMVGLALLGGLILNLMPCVLPVLSLKFLSVLGHGGRENADVRLGFLASVAGIVLSFLALAGVLVALKLAGASIGWGIQFQQPVFLAVMVVIVTLFACNLFGLFEVQLPQRINDLIAVDTGARHDHHHSLGGHFLTGMLATLLATPCSAPFLGTAVGFAMSRGPAEIFLIFGALGVGLSAPYLLVAAFPGMATRLPRPGNWMVGVKRFLGLLLAATGLWLVTVIAAESGRDVAIGVGALAVLMGAVLALRRLDGSRLGRHAGAVSAVLALAIVAA